VAAPCARQKAMHWACTTNGLDGDSGGILVAGEGDSALDADDESSTLHAIGGSNVPSGSDDIAVSKGTDSGGDLVTSEGDGALHEDDSSGALCRDVGSNMLSGGCGLDVRIPNDDLVVGDALCTGYRSMCGLDKGVLAGGNNSLGGGDGQLQRGRVQRTRHRRGQARRQRRGTPRLGQRRHHTGSLRGSGSGCLVAVRPLIWPIIEGSRCYSLSVSGWGGTHWWVGQSEEE
jgi:hypothetical protein